MNIKNRLILSHILTFFIPIVMTFFVLLLCAGGLALFAQSGHHIYAENVNQFQRITMVLHHVVFRNLRSHPDGNLSDIWLLGLLDPDYNCIMVNREGQVIYTYGNQFLAKETTPDIKQVMASLEQGSRGVRYASSPKKNYFMEKQVVKGRVYTLHYFNQIAPPASDEVFEQALHLTEFVCALSLLAFILLSSWFLSRFVLHHIIPPLVELQHASERIQEGDLGVRIGHDRQDGVRARDAATWTDHALQQIAVILLAGLPRGGRQNPGAALRGFHRGEDVGCLRRGRALYAGAVRVRRSEHGAAGSRRVGAQGGHPAFR